MNDGVKTIKLGSISEDERAKLVNLLEEQMQMQIGWRANDCQLIAY